MENQRENFSIAVAAMVVVAGITAVAEGVDLRKKDISNCVTKL
jgi:hypothetical protein